MTVAIVAANIVVFPFKSFVSLKKSLIISTWLSNIKLNVFMGLSKRKIIYAYVVGTCEIMENTFTCAYTCVADEGKNPSNQR
jgi:hypothetical protein